MHSSKRRHLNEAEARAAVSRGALIEQWLGSEERDGETVLRYVRVELERSGGLRVTYHEVIDDGGADFFDVYEFTPADPDEPDGVSSFFTDIDAAFQHCTDCYQARVDRFVNAGVIQDEYADYLSSRSTEPLGAIVERLPECDPDLTIYARKPWSLDSVAMLAGEPDSGDLPDAAASRGLTYFIEVDIALEFLQGWMNSQRRPVSGRERCEQLIQYALHDA
jgi:hypothetical protein